MAAILDHIHIGCANVYTTAFELTRATRLGHYDGGFRGDIGHKVVPLGGKGVYLEIESIVDPFAAADASRRPWWYKRAVAVSSPIFSGVCLRVDTIEQLTEIAKRHGGTVRPKPSVRTRPDGPEATSWEAPYAAGMADPWQTGRTTWCCWENRLYAHPSGQPAINAPGLVQPGGVAWLEMGGTKAAMQAWLGQNPDDLDMRFNGKPLGLYAIGVSTDAGEVEIRRPSATAA